MFRENFSEVQKKFNLNPSNTGSSIVQIAIFTKKINDLSGHFAKHKKDFHSNRGLIAMVSKRKKLLKYLSEKNFETYSKLIKVLGLRK